MDWLVSGWLYKNIGFQGMVRISLDSPYVVLFKDFLAQNHRLALDA